jgi:hypothetical protein
MAHTLPGIGFRDPANFAFAFDGPAYSQIVTDTLGNAATPGDDLDLGAQALTALMAAFESDVGSTDAADTIPDVGPQVIETASWAALAAEVALASTTELVISDALSFLADTFAVWGVLNAIISYVQQAIEQALSSITFTIIGSGGGGGGGGGPFDIFPPLI